jgi:hypothetical protein
MLSALARAIHNDVRNNDNQKLNLSAHPPEFHVRGASLTKCRGCVRPEDGEDRQDDERVLIAA